MSNEKTNQRQARLIARLGRLWQDQPSLQLLSTTIQVLNTRYALLSKMEKEPGVEEIIDQMFGRLANSMGALSNLHQKKILDIACGSNTSKLPASLYVNTPFGELRMGRESQSYTALFEPWFCRIILELGADAVGLDFGDLESEAFTHYRVDLGKTGALDFLPEASFDALQDSRLFGSPEFTAQFPRQADRLKVAQEIRRQERRLLKPDGIIIHSDAAGLVG